MKTYFINEQGEKYTGELVGGSVRFTVKGEKYTVGGSWSFASEDYDDCFRSTNIPNDMKEVPFDEWMM